MASRVRGSRICLRPGTRFRIQTAVYDLMWTEERDIGKPETLWPRPSARTRPGRAEGSARQALLCRARARCLQPGAHGRHHESPTIFLGRTRINGWHYYEVLQSVMEKQEHAAAGSGYQLGHRPAATAWRGSNPPGASGSSKGQQSAGLFAFRNGGLSSIGSTFTRR
jgi:hypothetical protein